MCYIVFSGANATAWKIFCFIFQSNGEKCLNVSYDREFIEVKEERAARVKEPINEFLWCFVRLDNEL